LYIKAAARKCAVNRATYFVKGCLMPPLNAALSRRNGIICDPVLVSNTSIVQSGRPAFGFLVSFMRSLLQAMRESRSEQAQREIHRFRHLIPEGTLKYPE